MKYRISRVFIFLVFFLFAMPIAYALDVYLIYAEEDKHIRKEVMRALPDHLKVKSYNLNLLAMADFSGKQKVISKISKARVVVFVKAKPKNILGTGQFINVVEIESARDMKKIIERLE